MRDNSLVNISGLDGHFMAIDMNIEHLINDIKVHFLSLLLLDSFNFTFRGSIHPRACTRTLSDLAPSDGLSDRIRSMIISVFPDPVPAMTAESLFSYVASAARSCISLGASLPPVTK